MQISRLGSYSLVFQSWGCGGDRYYWSRILPRKKKIPSLFPSFFFFLLHLLHTFNAEREDDAYTLVFILCCFTWADPQSISPLLSFILRAGAYSPVSLPLSRLLPLSLWASVSSYPPPVSHGVPFILSLLWLCRSLHHTLQGSTSVNMWL